MKVLNSVMALALVVFMASCGGGGQKTSETEESDANTVEENTASEVSYSVAGADSEITWRGEVAGVYGHDGTIDISEGTVTAKGSTITGGSVTIDMTTIEPSNPEEYADEDGKRASDLKNHLSTGDFFLVEEHPTATFVIKSHEGDKLVGDLTIRGNTNEETASITSLEVTPEGLKATADLTFDRQNYDVAWVHYMKDMILSDDIKLGISVVAKP